MKTIATSIALLLLSTFSFSQNWTEVLKTVALDRTSGGQYFGRTVAISGNYAIISSQSSTDVNGLNYLLSAGAVFIYEKDGLGNWQPVQKLVAIHRNELENFGGSVAISGNYAVVGASSDQDDVNGNNPIMAAGSAFIFERNGAGVWNLIQKITASDRSFGDFFGRSVSISGNYLIVGADGDREDADGLNPFSDAGSAYIFEKDGLGVWNQVKKITAPVRSTEDYFGISVSISGDYAIVGADREDQNALEGATMGSSGSAYVFKRDPATGWGFHQKITASDRRAGSQFGYPVAMDGDKIIVGARLQVHDALGQNLMNYAGAAYIFERNGLGNFVQKNKIVANDRAANDYFGSSVSISGDYAVVGANWNDTDASGANILDNAGSAYIYRRKTSGNWMQVEKIVASDRSELARFGCAVAVSGTDYLVGAFGEIKDANGLNPVAGAGAAYFYDGEITCSPSSSSIAVSACNRYTVPSGSPTYNFIGTQVVQDVIPTYCGFEDSTLNITVTIYSTPPKVGVINDTICFGESITVNGTVYDQTTVGAIEVFENVGPYDFNCDSTVTINLTVLPEKTGSITREICYGESVVINGTTYTAATTNAIEVFSNVGPHSCDSTVVVNITVCPELYDFQRQDWNEIMKRTAQSRHAFASYGYSVGISGNYAIVGASHEKYDENEQNPIDTAGAAYILERDPLGNWVEVQKIVASDRSAYDEFGSSVAISGNYIIVGAYKNDTDENGLNYKSFSGSLYIFKRETNGTWNEVQKVVASDRLAPDAIRFGEKIALSDDYFVVGSFNKKVNSLDYAGSAYVFKRNDVTNIWSEQQILSASVASSQAYFGSSVTIDGEYIAIGAINEKYDSQGLNPKNYSGAAYIFKRNSNGIWNQTQKITSSNRAVDDRFGSAIAISGNRLIVSSPYTSIRGTAYIFEKNSGEVWSQVDILYASDYLSEPIGRFGENVDISACVAVVSTSWSYMDNNVSNSLQFAGGAYVFERKTTGDWVQAKKLVASDRSMWDAFGYSAAISGSNIIVGAPGESEDAFGNNYLENSGSVYFFKAEDPCLAFSTTTNITACGTYTSPYSNTTWTTSGIYTEIDPNTSGCDSIHVFNVTINQASTSTISQTACGTYTSPSGNYTWNASGVYTDVLTNSNGCDSTITINLTIIPNTGSESFVSTCDNYTWFGSTYTNSGDFYHTLTNSSGCDSLITLHLTINNSSEQTETVAVCESSYTWSVNNVNYMTSGVYIESFTTIDGCDSIRTLNLTIGDLLTPVPDQTTLNSIVNSCDVLSLIPPSATDNCAGTITGTHNTTLPITTQGTTVVTWTYDDGNGNTSTQTQNVVITPIDNGISQVDAVTLSADASGYNYQWVDCASGNQEIDGATSQTFVATVNGNYAVEVDNGTCTVTSDCIVINSVGIKEIGDTELIVVFPNPTNGIVHIESKVEIQSIELVDVLGKLITVYSANENKIEINATPGVYFLRIMAEGSENIIRVVKQ